MPMYLVDEIGIKKNKIQELEAENVLVERRLISYQSKSEFKIKLNLSRIEYLKSQIAELESFILED